MVNLRRLISASPEDQLLLQIQGVIAEYEREKIAERSRRGKLHKAKSGKISVMTQAPYGFVYVKDGGETRYEIHPEEAQIVRRVFDLFCYQGMSIRTIARQLGKEGIEPPGHRGWWPSATIWRMLKNPAYFGRAAFRKTMSVP